MIDEVFLTTVRHKIIDYQNSKETIKDLAENIIKKIQTFKSILKKLKNKATGWNSTKTWFTKKRTKWSSG